MENRIIDMDRRLFRLTGLAQLADLFARHRALLVYLVIVALLSFTYDLFNFSLNIDSENHAFYQGAKAGWVNQGRWGMYLLNLWLLPDSVMPFTPTFLAVMGSAVGGFFLVLTLSGERSAADYFAIPVVLACPVLYFAFYFTTLGYGVGIAFAFANAGMYALTRGTWSGRMIAIPCFAFAVSIYQTVLPLLAVIFAFYMLCLIVDGPRMLFKDFLARAFAFLLVLAASYGCYEMIKRYMLYSMDLQYDESYLSGFIKFVPTQDYITESLRRTLAAGMDLYTGGKDYYLYELAVLRVLFFFSLAIGLIRLVTASRQGVWMRVIGLLVLCAALAAPLCMHFLNLGEMPPRTALAVPYVLAGLVFVAGRASSQTVKLLLGILVLACFYKFTVINNRYAFSSHMVWQSDRDRTNQLLARVGTVWHKLPPKNQFETYPIELVGVHFNMDTPVIVQREVVGTSFYNWAAGDVNRMVGLMKTMAINDYRAATREERLSVASQAMVMPEWPYEGSVDVVNGIIVVKIDEYNPNQIMTMCHPQPDHPFCQQHYKR